MISNLINKKNIFFGFIVLLIVVLAAAFFFCCVLNNKQSEKRNKLSNSLGSTDVRNSKSEELKAMRPLDSTDHIDGDINAPVQIIFYGDFDCPFCANFYETLNQVKSEFKDKVVIGFRHYPMRTHDMALTAALASECASEQNKFWEMYAKLFSNKKADELNIDQLTMDAKDLGLNADDFKRCLDDEKYKERVQNQWQGGKESGIIGTPGIVVNGEQIAGAKPFEDYVDQNGNKQAGLKSIIDKHLQDK